MTEPDEKGVYHGDEAYVWLEQESSIMLKAVTKFGEYRLKSTDEIVRDPDFLATWIVEQPDS